MTHSFDLSMTSQKRRARRIMEIFSQHNPNPQCELVYSHPFELLVAVVLSAQTTDKAVNQCTQRLFKVASTPEQINALGVDKLRQYISSLGLAPTKAKNLIRLSQQLTRDHQSQVPDRYDDLIALPGVGRKTANVVLAEIFGHPTLAVDTHVFRVGKRLQFHQASQPLAAERQLLQVIHRRYLPKAHHWLILHGRSTCIARKPKCSICIIKNHCPQKI